MTILLGLRRFKEAVNECTSALEAIPAYHKALVRRAKAYEQMGHFKQALSDIQKANKADTANPETQVGPNPILGFGSECRPPAVYHQWRMLRASVQTQLDE